MPSQNLNRFLWAGVLLLLVGLTFYIRDNFEDIFPVAGRLEVTATPEDNTVFMRWRGKIDAPMERSIAEAFEKYQGEARKFVLSLSSPGGALDHGARVIRLLRRIGESHELETFVGSGRRCASMCVPIFLAGETRVAASDAHFMFHEVSFREEITNDETNVPQAAIGSATDRFFAKYIAGAGVPESWTKKVRADISGGNEVWKTGQELVDEGAGIVQRVRE